MFVFSTPNKRLFVVQAESEANLISNSKEAPITQSIGMADINVVGNVLGGTTTTSSISGVEQRAPASISGGGASREDPIITEQLIADPVPEEDDNICEICYTDDKEIVLCWNGHMTCAGCRDAMWTMRDCFGQVKKKCGFCRADLFDWGASGLTDPSPHVQAVVRRYLAEFVRDVDAGRITREQYAVHFDRFHTDDFPDLSSTEYQTLFTSGRPVDPQSDLGQRVGQAVAGHPRQLLEQNIRFRAVVEYPQNYRIRFPLLHNRARMFPYGERLSCANGRIRSLNNLSQTHPDYRALRDLRFSEDQLAYSPNFELVRNGPGEPMIAFYRYIGRCGPTRDGCGVPFPQKDLDNATLGPRCGHCKQVGHTAEWHRPDNAPKYSTCPVGFEKDRFRKDRVDFCCIVQM